MSLGFLETIGLTKKEADLYELLLKLGETPANEIIKQSKLKRATAYKTLYSLEKKGLVKKDESKNIIRFRPESPDKLMNFADQQHEEFDRAREDLRATIPQLTSNFIMAVEKPVITTFEGVEGLKKIYEDTLREKKEIYAVLQTAEVNPELYDWLTKSYAKRRTKANIHASVIVASGKWSKDYMKKDEKENRTTVLVPDTLFPFQHEVDIYGDKVAFIHYKKGEALIGIVINHPHIAQTMKAWFDLAWKGAQSQTS